MKRLVAWLLVLGIVVIAAPMRADDEKKDKDKTEEKKKDDKKDEKKDEKKDTEKKVEKPTEAQKKELERLSGTFTVTWYSTCSPITTCVRLLLASMIEVLTSCLSMDGAAMMKVAEALVK